MALSLAAISGNASLITTFSSFILTQLKRFDSKNPLPNLLAPAAKDFICAPASQVFVDHSGALYSDRRSSVHKSLEMHACLKC